MVGTIFARALYSRPKINFKIALSINFFGALYFCARYIGACPVRDTELIDDKKYLLLKICRPIPNLGI